MKALFADILNLDDVWGVMLFSFEGEPLLREFLPGPVAEPQHSELWPQVIEAMGRIKEADLIFENSRIYVRRTDLGYLFVLLDAFAQTALVRLNCDILSPSLKEMKGNKGIRGFFKKKG
ncbi:MAG: hypothetical protein P8175_05750 [Deltaproteobacteria bacterium]|jgi:hypothetical protein